MEKFNDLDTQKTLLANALAKLPARSRRVVAKALTLAMRAHTGQLRDDGAPYIIHPIRVTLSLLKEFRYTSPTILASALLHDVVEDCMISLPYLRRTFGSGIAATVADLTDTRPPHETEAQKKIRKRKKLKTILTRPFRSRVIKCADLLDNVRSWPLLPKKTSLQKKLSRWLEEAHISYTPLARATDIRIYKTMKKAIADYKPR